MAFAVVVTSTTCRFFIFKELWLLTSPTNLLTQRESTRPKRRNLGLIPGDVSAKTRVILVCYK